MADLGRGLQSWVELLGSGFVEISPGALEQAQTATFATTQAVTAILHPADVPEVQACIRIANDFGIPLYPISSGKNWGYGSRVPPVDGCAILDLARLDRILEVNEELGYVTVEPGVTQIQLYNYLQESGSRFWMDATGSSPDTSLIGNCVERGFGHTPMGDRFSNVCGLQVVLPTGEIIETGAARFSNSRTGQVSKWGVGPSLDGLFSQSNLGIVTRLTIALMPAPEHFEAYFFRIEDSAQMPLLIDRLRDLRLKDVLRSSIHIANDYKVLAGLQQYPWADLDGETPLPLERMVGYRKKLGFGSWSASGGLYGTKAQVAESKRLLRLQLRGLKGSLKFLRPQTLRFAKRWARAFQMISGWDLRRTVELVEPVLGLMQGIPTRQPLASAYWRKKFPAPHDADPDRDRCGLLWYAPVCPASGKQVEELTKLASDHLLRFGFEPQISLTLLSPRTVSCIISITYDRDLEGEDEKARACHDELAKLCSGRGFYPYRLSILGLTEVHENKTYNDTLRRLKAMFDPEGILAPGRYERNAIAVSKDSLTRSS